MSGAEDKDYVLRQLRGLAQVMTRVSGLRVASDFEAARVELARACAVWLGADAALLEKLDPATVAGMLGDGEKREAYLAILEEEALVAEAEGDGARAACQRKCCAREDAPRSPHTVTHESGSYLDSRSNISS